MTGSHVAQAGFELTTELKLALPWDYKFAPPSLALSIYLILSAPTKRSCRSVHFVTAEISLSKCPYQQANKALEQQQIRPLVPSALHQAVRKRTSFRKNCRGH